MTGGIHPRPAVARILRNNSRYPRFLPTESLIPGQPGVQPIQRHLLDQQISNEDSADNALGKALDAAASWARHNAAAVTPSNDYPPMVSTNGHSPSVKPEGESETERDANRKTLVDTGARVRAETGNGVPVADYKFPILETLYELGGRARAKDVLARVDQKMKHIFCDADYRPTQSTDIQWHNRAQWQRLIMAKEGLLRNDSPRGIWELTDRGIAEVESRRR